MLARPLRSCVAAVLSLLAALAIAGSSLAARWQEIGTTGVTMDKVMVDLDSVHLVEGSLRTAIVMTVFAAPRPDKNGLVHDRRVAKDGVDCGQKSTIPIQVVAYLVDKQVGHSVELQDWKTKLKPVADPMGQRFLALVCAAPVGGLGAAGAAVTQAKTGSGIFVNDEGFILTNAHVISGCKTLIVRVLGSDAIPARLEAVDPKNDLALLKSSPGYARPLVFRAESRPVRLGEAVGVLGYPLTGFLSSEPKATFGEISSVAGANNDYTLLQFSAPIQPGSSGGPVLDQSGLVVGVTVSTASLALGLKIGAMPQNVNFAIKGELAQIFMTSHGVAFRTEKHQRELRTADLAELGERSTAQIFCPAS
jgi:S1-C subfamily serine protease